jgi:hypothetical protein
MRLLEYFDYNGFIYERGSIVFKGYFFQETHQTDTHVHFQDYQSDVISCQYSNLVCVTRIKLIEVQLRKKTKVRKWKISKDDVMQEHLSTSISQPASPRQLTHSMKRGATLISNLNLNVIK